MTHQVKLQPAADAIFKTHSDVKTVYLASNGQGFTEEDRAEAYANRLTNKKVYAFDRATKSEAATEAPGGVDEEREALLAKYETLYGKKAMFNISTKTLMERIAEKEAEPNTGATAPADEDTKQEAGTEVEQTSNEGQAANKEAEA